MSNIEWTKSSYSDPQQCVEVARVDGKVLLRDDKNPEQVVTLTPGDFDAFVKGVKAGEFDRFV